MTQPLLGKRIVVTRPRGQADALAGMIASLGGEAVLFPLIEISAAEDGQALPQALAQLGDYSLAVFVSPNAVDFSLPAVLAQGRWPETLRAAAVGQGSADALARYGVPAVIVPQRQFDSEALLALPEMQAGAVAGKRVLILRGNGGRELLADTLRARGARVDCVACYRRSPPGDSAAALLALRQAGRLDAFTVSSSEGLRNLLDLLDDAGRRLLAQTPVFVPHWRIQEVAEQLGLRKVVLTDAADAGILAGLRAYNWH